jgi:hypothetical protein
VSGLLMHRPHAWGHCVHTSIDDASEQRQREAWGWFAVFLLAQGLLVLCD